MTATVHTTSVATRIPIDTPQKGVSTVSLLHRSRLAPRAVPLRGPIGGLLPITSALMTMVGLNHASSAWSLVATAPTFVVEPCGPLWPAFKGSAPSPLLAAVRRLVHRTEVVAA